MVNYCCICKCRRGPKNDQIITLHKFPKDPDLKQQWIKAVNKKSFTPKQHDSVCSKHFKKTDFDLTDGLIKLTSEAIPISTKQENPALETSTSSIKSDDDNLSEFSVICNQTGQLKNVKCSKSDSSDSGSNKDQPSTSKNNFEASRRAVNNDHTYYYKEHANKMQQELSDLKHKYHIVSQQFRNSNKKIQQLDKKVATLTTVNKDLKSKLHQLTKRS